MQVFIGIIFVLIGSITFLSLPKRVNSIVGYRTPRSMKNDENWKFAQTYSGKLLMFWGILFLISGLTFTFLIKNMWLDKIIGLSLLVVSSILIIVRTESKLKRLDRNSGVKRTSASPLGGKDD